MNPVKDVFFHAVHNIKYFLINLSRQYDEAVVQEQRGMQKQIVVLRKNRIFPPKCVIFTTTLFSELESTCHINEIHERYFLWPFIAYVPDSFKEFVKKCFFLKMPWWIIDSKRSSDATVPLATYCWCGMIQTICSPEWMMNSKTTVSTSWHQETRTKAYGSNLR